MDLSHTQRARLYLLAVGLVVAGVGLGACSTTDVPAEAIGTNTVAISPSVSGSVVEPTTTSPAPTTVPVTVPVTLAVTTTTAPLETTTLPPETTTAPLETTTLPPETTTTLPAPTTSALAPNEEEVGPWPTPIPAVGRRSGADTQIVQMRLLQLGFWLSAPDGEYGLTTRQAVMAFQKYVALPANGEVTGDTAAYLTNLGIKGHGHSDTGTLVEIDKGRQLLFLIVDGKTQWVYNTSTATGLPYEEEDKNTPGEIQKGVSITPNGLWRVNRERPEGWWEGDLGEIYRPKYFRGGVAVHGSNSIPNYPASHGCVRLSVPAMDFIWDNNLIPMGTTVWVHE